jgi:hypothetical protein
MSEEKSLKTIEQEAFREQRVDGFIEINFGILLLIMFNLLYLQYEQPGPLSIFDAWSHLIFLIFGMFCFILTLLFYRVSRKKYVYPRIGYVKPRDDSSKVLSILIAVGILIFAVELTVIYFIEIGVVTIDWVYRWAPAFFGLAILGSSIYLKNKTGQNIYYLFGALMTITGFAVALADFIPTDMITAIYFDGWGITSIVLGAIKFVLFIRKYSIISTPEVANSEQ